eukprot:scaffold3720_cov141-Cylindrotheca_fusiformis.AAC.7
MQVDLVENLTCGIAFFSRTLWCKTCEGLEQNASRQPTCTCGKETEEEVQIARVSCTSISHQLAVCLRI